ncbi:MAG: ABC transporter substrate-binding protein [Pseudomonadota bacterium]
MSKLSTAACLLIAGTTIAAHAQSVKVGSVGAFTGPIAALIADVGSGRELAVNQINDQGGLFVGEHYELVVGDSACDAKAAVDAGQKVINVNQVVAVIGASCSGGTLGMVQSVTIPSGVVALSDSASASNLSSLDDNDTFFRTAVSDAYQGVALAELALSKGFKQIALTYASDDYNSALAESFISAYYAKGGVITANSMHEPDKASYRSEVASLSGGGAQALVLFAYYGNSGVTIIKNALETGSFDTFVAAEGMVHEEMVSQIGAENLQKAVFTTPGADTAATAYKNYLMATEEAGINATGPYVANGYDAAFVMGLAIEKAGSADRGKIAAALREVAGPPGTKILPGEWSKAKGLIAAGSDIDYVGASGEINFDANGDVTGSYMITTVNPDGSFNKVLMQ